MLYDDVQLPGRVLKIDFTKNRFRQINPVDTPSALRRDLRRGIVEVLIICLQETIVNLIQLIVEHLLGISVPRVE